jgi:GMP reductase
MKVEESVFFDFNDVLLTPKRSDLYSRSQVDLTRTMKFKHSQREWTGVPIMTSNMATTGTFEMYNVLSDYKMLTVLHKFYTKEQFSDFMDELERNGKALDRDYYSLSTGINEKDYERVKELIAFLNPHFLTVDIANGYSTNFVEFCSKVRRDYPELTIIAGNVATGDMVQELLLRAKVDIVKCGIGSGSVCSTRLKTGVGVPQLSVCMNCSEVANGLGGHIISDGGCTLPGDIAKAFGGGAHFVMLGGMIAGHDESGGETKEIDGKKYKLFYGMSSEYAQDKFNGGMKQYRSSEGKVRQIPYRGPVERTLMDILGGIRSTGTYIGAKRIKDFPKCATFLKVSRQVNTVFDSTNHLV